MRDESISVPNEIRDYLPDSRNRDWLKQNLASRGINTIIYYPIPIHMQPVYKTSSCTYENLDASEMISSQVLSLPIFPELSIEKQNFVIQGFGQVGKWVANIAYQKNYNIVAVSDVKGGIFNKNGIDIIELIKHYEKEKTFQNFKNVEFISNDELLTIDCDFLIPAAYERVINKTNAENINSKFVIEAANHPVTPDAEKILESKNISVFPDTLVNSGGVIVSYFEWIQNLYQHHWEIERVNSELQKIITKAFHEVFNKSEKDNINYRLSALSIGLDRVIHTANLRGYI